MKLYLGVSIAFAFFVGWNVFLIQRDAEMFKAYDACAHYTNHPDCPYNKNK